MRAPPGGDEREGAGGEQSSPDEDHLLGPKEVARYITDMTAQMETMAAAAKLDFLSYLLGMVRAESEAISRGRRV